MRTYIYFIRHTESPNNFSDEKNRKISEKGKIDAEKLANILKNENIDLVVSSSYKRAIETVKPLANILKKKIILRDELVERSIKNKNKIYKNKKTLKAIRKSFADIDYCLPGGETTKHAQGRAIPIIKNLLTKHRGKKIALGTHGNIMTIILNYFDKAYGFNFWLSTSKPDIYKAEFDGLKLKSVGRIWKK